MSKKCCDGGENCTCDLPQKKFRLKDVFNNAGVYLRTSLAGVLLTHVGFGIKDAILQGGGSELANVSLGAGIGTTLAAGGLLLWEKFWRTENRQGHRIGVYSSMILGIVFAAAVDRNAPPGSAYQDKATVKTEQTSGAFCKRVPGQP